MLSSFITAALLPFEASWELKTSPRIWGQVWAQLLAAPPHTLADATHCLHGFHDFHPLSPTAPVPGFCQTIQIIFYHWPPGKLLKDLASLNAICPPVPFLATWTVCQCTKFQALENKHPECSAVPKTLTIWKNQGVKVSLIRQETPTIESTEKMLNMYILNKQ